jgi:hypothetical protein
MKHLKVLLLVFILMGCSNDGDNSTPNSSDGTGGSLAIFALKENYLYTVDNAKLNIFSLVNTSQPSKVNEINIGFNIETLFSYGTYLFIGSRNGMFIYSLENPENPVKLSSAQHFTACDPVISNGTHSFVTLHSNTRCGNNINVLQIYNTANPSNPILVHQRNLIHPKGLGLYHNYLMVCDDDLKIFDIQNPNEPILVKAINKDCFDVIIKGDDLYAIGENGLYRYLLNQNNITNVILKSEITF